MESKLSDLPDDPEELKALVRQLQLDNNEKDEELDELEENLETALTSIKKFHVQQKELFDEVQHLPYPVFLCYFLCFARILRETAVLYRRRLCFFLHTISSPPRLFFFFVRLTSSLL